MTIFDFVSDFPAADRSIWADLVKKSVPEGIDPLTQQNEDKIPIQPVYTAQDAIPIEVGFPGAHPYWRGSASARPYLGWDIRQMQSHPNPKHANAALLEGLEQGANSLLLFLNPNPTKKYAQNLLYQTNQGGIHLRQMSDLELLLRDVALDSTPLELAFAPTAAESAPQTAHWLLTLLQQNGVPLKRVQGCLGLDPLAAWAGGGISTDGLTEALAWMGEMASETAARWENLAAVRVDGGAWYGAGASEAQDLACILATGVSYLRIMQQMGLKIDQACRQIAFSVEIGTNLFDAMAKLRAARWLWGRICHASGACEAASAMRLGACVSGRIFTQFDVYTNMLRNTGGCLAAALGGADWITVPAHDTGLHNTGLHDTSLGQNETDIKQDRFAQRMARNVQIILQEEAGLGRVMDPAGGSWFIDSLTQSLGKAAWTQFQKIEAAGGMIEACASGMIESMIKQTHQDRARKLACRQIKLTGINEFPNLAESPKQVQAIEVPQSPKISLPPLPRHRLSASWEALRLKADQYYINQGHRPQIFIVRLGVLAHHSGPARLAHALFAAGGIEAIDLHEQTTQNNNYNSFDSDVLSLSFKDSGVKLAVLCGRETDYTDQVGEVVQKLKAAGCKGIWLMGKPNADWKMPGIDGFVYEGADIIAIIQQAQHLLGFAERKGQ